jgi:hypothetical protein
VVRINFAINPAIKPMMMVLSTISCRRDDSRKPGHPNPPNGLAFLKSVGS